jgi:DNA-binding PadR family transcriptional regulator
MPATPGHERITLPNRRYITAATMRVLKALLNEPLSAYTVLKRTGLQSGSVYPLLKRLEDQGFIERNADEPKLWQLTELGRRDANSVSDSWRPHRPGRHTVTTTLPTAVYEQIVTICEKNDTSVQAFIRHTLIDAVDAYQQARTQLSPERRQMLHDIWPVTTTEQHGTYLLMTQGELPATAASRVIGKVDLNGYPLLLVSDLDDGLFPPS